MRLLTILLVLTSALAFASTTRAQTPTPTETVQPAPTIPTGSIAGRIIVEGQPGLLPMSIMIVPADLPQPITYGVAYHYFDSTDFSGNFSATALADGEYLIVVGTRGDTFSSDLTESVTLMDVDTFTLPALRVTVANGEAVTDIVITLVYPTPAPAVDGFGELLEPSVTALPVTGTGTAAGRTSGTGALNYGAVAFAGGALLLGALAWRRRAERR
jgi:hypothetical protein